MRDLALQIRGDALEPADRHRLSVYAGATAGRLTRAIARAPKNSREHVRLAVQHVGVGVPPERDQPDVLGDVRMRRTGPLAVDDLMVIARIVDVGGLHVHTIIAARSALPLRPSGAAVRASTHVGGPRQGSLAPGLHCAASARSRPMWAPLSAPARR